MLIPPFLALVLGVLWTQSRARLPRGDRPVPPAPSHLLDVATWSGSLDLAPGGRLRAVLTELHSDRSRQKFDQLALGERLGLSSGEPFRLRLHLDPAEDSADGDTLVAHLDLATLRVESASGEILRPLPSPPDGSVVDPLLVLLAPTSLDLRPGQETDLILWGDWPSDRAQLTGVSPSAENQALELNRGMAEPAPRRGELGSLGREVPR